MPLDITDRIADEIEEFLTEAERGARAARADWFTEGFNTRDLKEAKALLDELAS